VCGVASFAYELLHALAARYDAGEALPVHDSWRIDENRWAAMRDGVDGTLADLETGRRVPTRELLASRLPSLHPATQALIEANGAVRTRAAGVEGAVAYLADQW
jgi:carboxylate-amine ligase